MKKRILSMIILLFLGMIIFPSPAARAADDNPFDKQDNKTVPYEGGLYFGVSEQDTENAATKPQITVDKLGFDDVPTGEIAVNISIYDAAGNWSASGLHIGYDTRLTLVPRSDGKPFEVGDACTPLMNSIRKIRDGRLYTSTSGSSDKGRNGVMYTLYFRLPDNAKAGDIFPVGIFYNPDKTYPSLFSNTDQDEEGLEMQSWVFYKGITNGFIRINGGDTPPEITQQPESQKVNEGKSVLISVAASGEDLMYRWEYRETASGTWKTKSDYEAAGSSYGFSRGWDKADLALTSVTAAMNGMQFRCKIDGNEGSCYSDEVTLTVISHQIFTVSVIITPPAVGASPDYYPVLPSDAYYYSDSSYSSNYSKNDVTWYDMTDLTTMEVSASFETGHAYTVEIVLTSEPGCAFVSPLCRVNGEEVSRRLGTNSVTLTVNFPELGESIPNIKYAINPVPDTAAVNETVSFTVITPTTAQYIAMYDKNGQQLKKWSTGYWDSGNSRVWTADYAFKTAGSYTVTFKASANGTVWGEGKDCSVTIHEAPGWKKNSKGWWYLREDGTYPKDQWEKIGGKWYHFDSSGYMQTGWQKIGSVWYYLGSNGAMVTGWKQISGKWYYFKSSGAMATGWQKISDKWYYFESSGAMVTGWKTISGKTYYFKSGGAMAAKEWCSGYWLNADGTWTYPYKAKWTHNSKGWWYGDTSGWYAKNVTITIDGKSYTFDAQGYMK